MNMMKIEEVVGDVILIILENYEPLKKIGIESDKIFARVKVTTSMEYGYTNLNSTFQK